MRAFSLGLIISDPHTNGLFANQHHKGTKQYNSTTDRNWPITENLRHLSLTANNTTLNRQIRSHELDLVHLTDNYYSLDYYDFR